MRHQWLFALVAVPLLAAAPAPTAVDHGAKAPRASTASVHKTEETPSPFSHVMDQAGYWHIFETLNVKIPLFRMGRFRLTKFMILEVLAALLILAIYIPLGRRARTGEPGRGGWHNAFEGLLTFIRDDVARPNLGEHDADTYVPFLWTMFLFILFCNLLGMIPFLGSPTASIWVTGGLAVCSFFAMHGAAVAKMGIGHYLKSLWPHLDIPIPVVGFFIKAMICGIEVMGNVIKNAVLAVRLFANMFAGHTVLAMIMLFIIMAANASLGLWASITIGSVLGVVALSLLELFVAFLQAYIFVFLMALFMGMTLHPAH